LVACINHDVFSAAGLQGEYAISPANHGEDQGAYFPSSVVLPWKREANLTHASLRTRPALTGNQSFINSFSQSFLAVVMSLDPNEKFDSADVTPQWDGWGLEGTEMLFNVTEADEAVIHPIPTDPGLLARCR
jgi:hypothetical protein